MIIVVQLLILIAEVSKTSTYVAWGLHVCYIRLKYVLLPRLTQLIYHVKT